MDKFYIMLAPKKIKSSGRFFLSLKRTLSLLTVRLTILIQQVTSQVHLEGLITLFPHTQYLY
jgi:hypothetical protein